MKLTIVLAGLMAFVSSAVPVDDTARRSIVARGTMNNDSHLHCIPSTHVVPATESYAFNGNIVTIRDSDINPPHIACFDIYEKANLDFTGPKMLGVCTTSIAWTTIIDPKKPRAKQILKTIGSLRIKGNTTCGVYKSDNCQEGTLHETISEKNMLSWPPAIPMGSWRASLHCYRNY